MSIIQHGFPFRLVFLGVIGSSYLVFDALSHHFTGCANGTEVPYRGCLWGLKGVNLATRNCMLGMALEALSALLVEWWTLLGSNQRPLPCEGLARLVSI
jgi:hypothetical protein